MLTCKLFLSVGREVFDPSIDDNLALYYLITHDNIAGVKVLLKDKRVTPTPFAIWNAIIKDNDEMMKLVLSKPRIDEPGSSHYDYCILNLTCERGNLEILELLLKQKYYNPTSDPLRTAISYGHVNIVKRLLEDSRVDGSIPLLFAIEEERTEMIKLLLKHPKTDPIFNRYNALRRACIVGKIEIVKLLLADPRVDPAAENNEALRIAINAGNLDIVTLLMNDERVTSLLQ